MGGEESGVQVWWLRFSLGVGVVFYHLPFPATSRDVFGVYFVLSDPCPGKARLLAIGQERPVLDGACFVFFLFQW